MNLKDQGITAVRRISIHWDSKLIPTKHLILTFNKPILPTSITAGYLRCPVRPYIPNLLRRFKCQQFGHSQTSCRGKNICTQCGVKGNQSTECTTTPCCVNCKHTYPAYSRKCPAWQTEKEIQRESLTRHAKCLLIPSKKTPEKESIKPKTLLQKTGVITRNLGSKKASKNPINTQRVKVALSKCKKSEAHSMSEFSDISDEETNQEVTKPTSPPKEKPPVRLKRDTLTKNVASNI
ncbi:uncharacterized protein LOC111639471 [Centruroides sculpturatus]|uniref:uncharacterized protein LOC111639471 n=1 Tax=Centruroides sculpturatus TaxID=218467 RepID=UPI000C6DACD7|nr:uncharacterized protein LOC111639471 [Centruroides sculpturatus]